MIKDNKITKQIKKNNAIVHITPFVDRGGAEYLVKQLFKFLKKKKFIVSTIYFYNPTKLKLNSNEYCLNFSKINNFKAIWKLRKILIKISKKKNLILHAHLSLPLYLLPFITYGIKSKNIFTEHNTYYNRRKYFFLKFFEKYIYSKYSKIVCVSRGVEINLLKWLNISNYNKKIIVVPNGARFFNLINRKKLKKKIKLISIGSLTKQKGFDIAIKAIYLIKDQIESYTILGEGDQRDALINLAQSLKIKDKIIFPGYVKNINSYLKNNEIGLLSSRWEGFGLSVIEMLSSGLPMVCSNVAGVRDVVKNCSAVKLVDCNPDKIAKGILRLKKYIEKNDYTYISLQARKHAESYSLKKMLNSYEKLYLNI